MPEYPHVTTTRIKHYETSATFSASLTTQSYLGQGLGEQSVPVRTQLSPDTELRRQEPYIFPTSFGGEEKVYSSLASRYHRILYCSVRCLYVDDPRLGSEDHYTHNKVTMLRSL